MPPGLAFLPNDLPAERQRLSARFSCQGRPLRSREREPRAPLTARAASRRGPLGRSFVFYALLRVASEAKINPFERSSYATKHTTTVVFTRPTRRHTGRAGRSRKGRARAAGLPLSSRSRRLGRSMRGRPQ